MASEITIFSNPVAITGGVLKLEAGNYNLVWGTNFDPSNLPAQRVQIIADCKKGDVRIQLPPLTDGKSQSAVIVVVANNSGADNPKAYLYAAPGQMLGPRTSAEPQTLPVTGASIVLYGTEVTWAASRVLS